MDPESGLTDNEPVDVLTVDTDQYECRICQAHATGFHFDAQSCSACAAFFRRAVVLGREYKCVNGANICPINYRERTLCRSCRMSKCLLVGMKKTSVQKPNAQTKRARSYYTQSGLKRNKRFALTDATPGPAQRKQKKARSDPPSAVPTPASLKAEEAADLEAASSPACSYSQPRSQPDPDTPMSSPGGRCTDEELLQRFVREEMKIGERRRIMFCERPVAELLGLVKDCCYTQADIKPLQFRRFRKSIRTHILLIYEWLRAWPAYNQLEQPDQLTCFRKCALYHTLLDPCFITTQLGDRTKFVMQNGGYVSTGPEMDAGWEDEKEISRENKKKIYGPLLNRIKSDMLDPLFVLNLSFDECVALKALVTIQMTIPDVSAGARQVLKGQLDQLIQCLYQNYPPHVGTMDRAERMGNILMLLSPIVDTATNFVESHHQVQFFDIWQLDSLMLQFLKYAREMPEQPFRLAPFSWRDPLVSVPPALMQNSPGDLAN